MGDKERRPGLTSANPLIEGGNIDHASLPSGPLMGSDPDRATLMEERKTSYANLDWDSKWIRPSSEKLQRLRLHDVDKVLEALRT